MEERLTRGIDQLAAAMRSGATTSVALVQAALARISDPAGQGQKSFVTVMEEKARYSSAAADQLIDRGYVSSRLAGLPISVKDLFDIAGQVTRSGSKVLNDAAAAVHDAAAVSRLKAAGAIVVGRTNMTEFAYSGLGLNPHYGTPLNPFDRPVGRIPGGSSSGAAISVADGMVAAAIGSDTGGSLRIPAALCGLVGFKASRSRMPMNGVLPLSQTLDTIGPIARTVSCCACVDAILAGAEDELPAIAPRSDLCLGILSDVVMDHLDPWVSATFDRAVSRLSEAGVRIREVRGAQFLNELAHVNRQGGFAAAESYAALGDLVMRREAEFDPRVAVRIKRGASMSAQHYQELHAHRTRLMKDFQQATWSFDAVMCPTVPMIAPLIKDFESDESYHVNNLLMLRNPSVANFMDRPSSSLPCHEAGSAPVGLMLIGRANDDRKLLAIAALLESVLSYNRGGVS